MHEEHTPSGSCLMGKACVPLAIHLSFESAGPSSLHSFTHGSHGVRYDDNRSWPSKQKSGCPEKSLMGRKPPF